MPFSRGSVHLSHSAGAAGGAAATPVIDPEYYLVDDDLALQTRVARLTTSFYESEPLTGVVEQVAGPPGGAGTTTTDEQWGEYLRTGLTGNAHCVSTAAMMRRDLGGVVDGRLRVYGTEGLRVVDASVVPMQVSGHLTAMLYAIAQRASEVILDVPERAFCFDPSLLVSVVLYIFQPHIKIHVTNLLFAHHIYFHHSPETNTPTRSDPQEGM